MRWPCQRAPGSRGNDEREHTPQPAAHRNMDGFEDRTSRVVDYLPRRHLTVRRLDVRPDTGRAVLIARSPLSPDRAGAKRLLAVHARSRPLSEPCRFSWPGLPARQVFPRAISSNLSRRSGNSSRARRHDHQHTMISPS